MKRIFALTVCLALAALMLCSCGDDEIYDRPGTGTTLGSPVTTPVPDDDGSGTYSADENGDVSKTTDGSILEDGMDDLENGLEKGAEDIEKGAEDLGEDVKDMMDGDRENPDGSTENRNEVGGSTDGETGDVTKSNPAYGTPAGSDNAEGMNGDNNAADAGMGGMSGENAPAQNGSEVNGAGQGVGNTATNGNSH